MRELSGKEIKWYETHGPNCQLHPAAVESIADFFDLIHALLLPTYRFFFRGHADGGWQLVPTALRPASRALRQRNLGLLKEFKRVAATKVSPIPNANDDLTWLGIAQHYGLPTRMLDWTENPAIGLYFSCGQPTRDGAFFILNPSDLNRTGNRGKPRVLDPFEDRRLIEHYLQLGPDEKAQGRRSLAILPAYNNQRILLQRGAFTLHGDRRFGLDVEQAPSLVCLPILKSSKPRLQRELDRIGVNEISIFPEPEHVCAYLRASAEAEEAVNG